MSGNENSEEETNFVNRLKEKNKQVNKIDNSEKIYPYKQNEITETNSDLEVDEGLNENKLKKNKTNFNSKSKVKEEWNSNFNKRPKSKNPNKIEKSDLNRIKVFGNNTEINNKRFEVKTAENKRNIVNRNMNKSTPKIINNSANKNNKDKPNINKQFTTKGKFKTKKEIN